MTDSIEVKDIENKGHTIVNDVAPVAHDVERDTRGLIYRLWDDAESDASKGIAWFKAEIAKL